MAQESHIATCLLTFDPKANKRIRNVSTEPLIAPRPNVEAKIFVPGGSFIPRGGIRSQIQLDKSRRFRNVPLIPATITYSRTYSFIQSFPCGKREAVYKD